MSGHRWFAALAIGLAILAPAESVSTTDARVCAAEAESAAASELPIHRRQPVALTFVDNGRGLLVANRQSGSVSTIDVASGRVVKECRVGKRPSDLVALPGDDRRLLATDEQEHRLLLLECDGNSVTVAARLSVADSPVSVRVAGDGRHCFVASLWSRRLTVVRLAGGEGGHGQRPAGVGRASDSECGDGFQSPSQSGCTTENGDSPTMQVERSIALPFAPRLQVWHEPAQRLIVADAFGGQLAVIDPAGGTIESVRSLPAHNIRGLALSADGKSLHVAHQILSRLARTTVEDIHWGSLMANLLRTLPVDVVLNPGSELLKGSRSQLLGDVGRAAGDPAGIAVAGETLVVAFAGVGEAGLLRTTAPYQRRVSAGTRPTVVAVHPQQKNLAFVADAEEDAVCVLDVADLDAAKPHAVISLGHRPELTLAERGERLFHDARLSHDRWMSCQSCHTDGHSNGLLNDNLGDGSFDAPKRVLSLLGVADTAPFAWNGGMSDLESQIRKSIQSTMRGPDPTDEQVVALAAYLKTLLPAPPVSRPAERDAARGAIDLGQALFHSAGCVRCHVPGSYTSAETYDVGIHDEVGNTKFNPPSLRGVSQRDRLFHDNRAGSLEEAFTKHRHQVPADFSAQDITDLVEYLRSL